MGQGSDEKGIRWGQAAFCNSESTCNSAKANYNAKTPDDTRGIGGHALVGCVATAMGQVMRYYGEPIQGEGFFRYYDNSYGWLYANFGETIYQWSSMPYELDESSTPDEVNAVSTLLYHTGVSVEMEYGANASNAYYYQPNDKPSAVKALKTYFGYTNAVYAERVSALRDGSVRTNYGWEEWEEILKSSLDAGDPILYGGTGTGGHAFVMDGYRTDGTYHINWGYNGVANGWYRLSSLGFNRNGYEYDFSNNQQAVFLNRKGTVEVDSYDSTYDSDYDPDYDPDLDPEFGGGCTYNPHAVGMDGLMLLMIVLALVYPFGRRYLTARG
jgi:hypothetical protein